MVARFLLVCWEFFGAGFAGGAAGGSGGCGASTGGCGSTFGGVALLCLFLLETSVGRGGGWLYVGRSLLSGPAVVE